MAVEQRISEEQYQQFVLAQPDGQWELHDGRLVQKPGLTWEHADIATELAYLLRHQIPRDEYRVFIESRVRRPAATIFFARCHGRAHRLWGGVSRSTGYAGDLF